MLHFLPSLLAACGIEPPSQDSSLETSAPQRALQWHAGAILLHARLRGAHVGERHEAASRRNQHR